MKASDFVTTGTSRIETNENLVHTELTDAVNTGIVERADKSGSVLKDSLYNTKSRTHVSSRTTTRAAYRKGASRFGGNKASEAFYETEKTAGTREVTGAAFESSASGKAFGYSATGAAFGHAVNRTLEDSELEGADVAYYRTKGAAKATKAIKERIFDKKKLDVKGGAIQGAKGAAAGFAASTIQDTELDGLDDVYYGGRTAYRAGKRLGSAVSKKIKRAPNSDKPLGQLSEKKYASRKAAKTSVDVQRDMQKSRYMHRSVQETAKAAAVKKGGITAVAGSASSGGGTLLTLGGGTFILAVIAVILAVLIIITAICDHNNNTGQTIEIPEPYGSVFTVTGYDTYGWRFANSSNGRMTIRRQVTAGTGQYDVWTLWKQAGAVYTSHIATLNGRFLIACKPLFGSCGDNVDFYLSDGTVLHCVIADIKGDDGGGNQYAHADGSVVEFEVDPEWYNSIGCANPGTSGWEVVGYPGINNGARTTKCVNLSRGGGSIVDCAIAIANDDSHGYSQSTADGGSGRGFNPDVDCSSFVYYTLLQAGYTTDQLGNSPFTTYDMAGILTSAGFTSFAFTGDEGALQAGDILLRSDHTEIYIGNGQRVGAHSNYDGSPGDSSGREVSITSGIGSWQTVLRAPGN